jgi:FkbH-like protein
MNNPMHTTSTPPTPCPLGARLKGLNVLLMGTCQLEPLVDAAPVCGHKISHMLCESYRHAAIPAVDVTGMDAAVVGITLRHLMGDATGLPLAASDMFLARLQDGLMADALLAQCVSLLTEKLTLLHATLRDVPTFFLSFFEPSFNYPGNLTDRNHPGLARQFLRRLNEQLNSITRTFANFYFIDVNEILNFVGRMHIQDDVVYATTHASFITDFDFNVDRNRLQPANSIYDSYDAKGHAPLIGKLCWNLIADNLAIIRQTNPVKLIIVDLDDTLWRGVAAEETLQPWMRVEGWPLGFVEALLYFKNRGGLLAICSKNDYASTIEQLSRIWQGAITVDDFASIKISWNPKSESVAEILAETNILSDNALLVDDNPREVDEVRTKYPGMRYLSDNHLDWRRIILRSAEAQVPRVTAESLQRTKLVRAHIEREVLGKSMPRAEWLASLNLVQTFYVVREVDSDLFGRAVELLNKTNQFNTTGRRWETGEMGEFFESGGVCLLTSLQDKIMDNGVVGAALIKDGDIVQAVLSCRVFGLGAEVALGRFAIAIALDQAEVATGRVIDTGKNFTCHGYFETLGFKKLGDRLVGSEPCAAPDWITTPDLESLGFAAALAS